MRLCDFLGSFLDKVILNSTTAPVTDERKNYTKVQAGEPMSLLVLPT